MVNHHLLELVPGSSGFQSLHWETKCYFDEVPFICDWYILYDSFQYTCFFCIFSVLAMICHHVSLLWSCLLVLLYLISLLVCFSLVWGNFLLRSYLKSWSVAFAWDSLFSFMPIIQAFDLSLAFHIPCMFFQKCFTFFISSRFFLCSVFLLIPSTCKDFPWIF